MSTIFSTMTITFTLKTPEESHQLRGPLPGLGDTLDLERHGRYLVRAVLHTYPLQGGYKAVVEAEKIAESPEPEPFRGASLWRGEPVQPKNTEKV